MHKSNKENGYLVIEASLALFFFTFFILFIWSFSGVFAAQNMVSHATMQTVQSIAVDNLSKVKLIQDDENVTKTLQYADNILKWFNGGQSVINGTNFAPFKEQSNKKKIISDSFYYYIGGSTEDGKQIAKAKGINTDNVTFEIDENALNSGVLKIKVYYDVRLKFNIFGRESLKLTKCAECKLFGKSK